MHAIVAAMNFMRYFQEMNLIECSHPDTEQEKPEPKSSEQDPKQMHLHISPMNTPVHRAIIKREERWKKQTLDLQKLGARLNPLRYVGQLMRITEFCVDAVRNSIFARRPISDLQVWLKAELKYRPAD